MVYDLKDSLEREQFAKRVEFLLGKHSGCVELTEKRLQSLSQNNYAHVAIQYFALQVGMKAAEVKEAYFKRACNADIFVRRRYDKILHRERRFMRSTSDLSPEEMSTAIERFLQWASIEAGIYIPPADEYVAVQRMQHDVQRNIKNL